MQAKTQSVFACKRKASVEKQKGKKEIVLYKIKGSKRKPAENKNKAPGNLGIGKGVKGEGKGPLAFSLPPCKKAPACYKSGAF
jgi:hypothetical protein